ncbi:MAG: hypothetical protein HZB16_18285 [Armatimonadetes bacterium]|nr:hypothetical protein [Armatimonadota bacterium]
MRRTVLALLLLTSATWAERPQGPQIGRSPSAVLDDQGQRVGTGPELGILGPAPKPPTPTAAAPDTWGEATRWVAAFLEQFGLLDHDMQVIGFMLRANVLAIRELEAEIAGNERLLATAVRADLREVLQRAIDRAKGDLAELTRERDERLNAALERWTNLHASLADKIAESADKPEVSAMLTKLETVLQRRQTIGELTLYLQAGYAERFRTLAGGAEQDPALAPHVLLLRVQDQLDGGHLANALLMARDGAQRYADQAIGKSFAVQAQSLDVAYMKALADTFGRESDQIQKAWSNYSGQVSDSYIKQFFTGSMRHSFEYYAGRTDRLAALAGEEADQRAMGGHGLQVMIRLRDAGLSFKEIMALDGDGIRSAFKQKLGAEVSFETADMMNTAVSVALRDQRLMNMVRGDKVASEADLRAGWAGKAEFEDGLLAHAADAINVKNALLLLGPGAVVSSAGTGASLTARFAQVVGRGVSGAERMEALFGTGLDGAVTARDWLSSAARLPEVAGALAKTKTGAALRDGLNTWFSARYDGPLAARIAMGAEGLVAELAIFETAGRAGKAVGGQVGEFFGQAMATLVGNPAELAHQAFGKARTAAVAATMAEFRAAERGRALAREVSQAGQTVDDAASRLTRGETLSADELARVEEASATARRVEQEALAVEQQAGGPGPSSSTRGPIEQAQATDGLAQAVRRGDAEAVQLAQQTSQRLAGAGEEAAGAVREAESGLQQASQRVAEAPASGASAAGSDGPLVNDAATPIRTKVPNSADLGSGARAQAAVGSAPSAPPLKLARNAMRAGEFGEAEAWYRQAALNPELNAEDVKLVRAGITEARQAQRYARILAERAEAPWIGEARARADKALEPLSADEKGYLSGLDVNQQTRFSDFFGTEPTAGGPRVVFDREGRMMGLWKPAAPPGGAGIQGMPDDGNLVSEVFVSRLAKKLGLNVPRAEPVSMLGVGGRTVDGVFIRWVPGTHIVHKLEPGARAVLAEQIAAFRALSAYTGNYDVHLGNYLVDGSGRVWGIDFGNAALGKVPVEDANILRQIMHVPNYPLSGDQVVDEARLLRDAYTYRKVTPGTFNPKAVTIEQGDFYKEEVAYLDRLLPAAKMTKVADGVRDLSAGEIETLLQGTLRRGSEAANSEAAKEIAEHLAARGKSIDKIIDTWKSTDKLDSDVLVPAGAGPQRTPTVGG